MQEKIKLLNDGNQRLNDLYTDGIAENRNLQNKLDTCENRVMSLQSTLDQCQSDYQDAVISRKELELCRDELIDEQNAKEALNKNFEIMESENTELRNKLTSEKAENENLRNRIEKLRKLEYSLSSGKYQKWSMKFKVWRLKIKTSKTILIHPFKAKVCVKGRSLERMVLVC